MASAVFTGNASSVADRLPGRGVRVVTNTSLVPLAVLGLMLALTRSAGIDDAYISYRYAEQLVAGHGLVFNPGERVEGMSNALWTLLLAGLNMLGMPLPTAGYRAPTTGQMVLGGQTYTGRSAPAVTTAPATAVATPGFKL